MRSLGFFHGVQLGELNREDKERVGSRRYG